MHARVENYILFSDGGETDTDFSSSTESEIDYPDEQETRNMEWSSERVHENTLHSYLYDYGSDSSETQTESKSPEFLELDKKDEKKDEQTMFYFYEILSIAEKLKQSTLLSKCPCGRSVRKNCGKIGEMYPILMRHGSCKFGVCWMCGYTQSLDKSATFPSLVELEVHQEHLRSERFRILTAISPKYTEKARNYFHLKRLWALLTVHSKNMILKQLSPEQMNIWKRAMFFKLPK